MYYALNHSAKTKKRKGKYLSMEADWWVGRDRWGDIGGVMCTLAKGSLLKHSVLGTQ